MNKRVVLSGSTGFLGPYIKKHLGHFELKTVGRNREDDYYFDLEGENEINDTEGIETDYLVHVAALAHRYPKNPQEEYKFHEVNCLGTQNLIRLLKIKQLKAIVFISTIAVYGLDSGLDIDENTPLSPSTAYGKSKACAEQYLRDFCKRNGINLLILRLPLVSGIDPPGNLGKMIKGISRGFYLSINNGKARKSIVLADDVGLLIANSMNKSGTYNLSDDVNPSFRDLELEIMKKFKRKILLGLPKFLMVFMARVGDYISIIPFNSSTLDKMSKDLIVSCEKAKQELDWRPRPVVPNLFKI